MAEIIKTNCIFISHISEEALIADEIKDLLQRAFGQDVSVFVSSDYESIVSGEEWYRKIVTSIISAKVVLVLISKESVGRPWINFEAGVGAGSFSRVIPISIKGFNLGQLKPPLQPLQARNIHDVGSIKAMLKDIGRELGRDLLDVDASKSVSKIKEIEKQLPYKGLSLKPFTQTPYSDSYMLGFELLNTGNMDMELIAIEVCVPRQVLNPNWHPMFDQNVMETKETSIDEVLHLCMKYKVFEGAVNRYFGDPERLPRYFTPAMSPHAFKDFHFSVRRPLSDEAMAMKIKYRIYAREFNSEWHQITLKEIIGGSTG